ncbi:uncharacterized protein N7529_011376 [Penicillium soppii]|uniref:uncharacterized protein n=1 Tax=Penicillium soppii TaxID=69789 RepID=UPI00254820E4|nr:uncharacterized protein N7529_011376 [Penicillium soppii]KAJ5851991.1 hypothetical protein N7529_011376 [Penicillium soppii]
MGSRISLKFFPFLSGNVASTTRVPGEKNVLEVQPATQANHEIVAKPYPPLNEDFVPNRLVMEGEDPSACH